MGKRSKNKIWVILKTGLVLAIIYLLYAVFCKQVAFAVLTTYEKRVYVGEIYKDGSYVGIRAADGYDAEKGRFSQRHLVGSVRRFKGKIPREGMRKLTGFLDDMQEIARFDSDLPYSNMRVLYKGSWYRIYMPYMPPSGESFESGSYEEKADEFARTLRFYEYELVAIEYGDYDQK